MIQNVGWWCHKNWFKTKKKLEDGVRKMLDQRWRRKFPLLSPRRSHNWRRSIKENDPRAAATKMSSHNVQTPDTCLMSDVYHHLIARLIIIQEHFGATNINSYLSIKANDLRAATTKMSSHLNRMFRHLTPARCENCLISLVDNNLCLEYFQAPKLSSYLYSCPPP